MEFIHRIALDSAFNPFKYKEPYVIESIGGEGLLDIKNDASEIKRILMLEYDRLKSSAYKDFEADQIDYTKERCYERLRKRLKTLNNMLEHTYLTLFNEVPYV